MRSKLITQFLKTGFVFAQAAGNAVKRASDNLVRAAQKAAFDKAEDNSVIVKTKFVGGIAQVRFFPCLSTAVFEYSLTSEVMLLD